MCARKEIYVVMKTITCQNLVELEKENIGKDWQEN